MESVISGFLPAPPSQFAASRTRASTSSSDTTAAIFARGRTRGEVAGEERHFRVGLGAGGILGGGRRPVPARSIFCALKGGMLADSSETESDRLPATRMNGRTRTISRLPLPRRRGGHANDLARGIGLAGRRQPIGLARRIGDAVGDAADGAAQRRFDALRHGGEIGLAVERCENGAAHESGAAKTGQDGAAEPLDRDAAAVHQAAVLAVDGQRRLVAEIDVLGLQARSKCAASFALIQARRPLRPRRERFHNTEGAKRDRDDRR